MAEDLASKNWVVTGEYITVPTMTSDGKRIVGRYKGSPVPPGVPEHILAHHLRMNLIAEAPPGAPPPPPATGSVEEQGAPDEVSEAPPVQVVQPPAPVPVKPATGGRRPREE